MTVDRPKLIAIVGPTAVGKSELAMRLAEYFPAEIISADSRQIYRYMDIGTNKPSLAERESVPHHAIDVVDPDEDFSLSMYNELALDAVDAVHKRGNLPLLVGGSGLYVWSLIDGWKIPRVTPDREQRRMLEARAERDGGSSLHRELLEIDPVAAAEIGPHNTRRIIRALEIYRATGQRPSEQRRKEAPGFATLVIGLTQERRALYTEIDRRVDHMIRMGLADEVEGLLERGYRASLPSMSGIGYRQMAEYLQGQLTLSQAADKTKVETHRMARHQYAWFRQGDTRIRWLDAGDEARTDNAFRVRCLVEGFVS